MRTTHLFVALLTFFVLNIQSRATVLAHWKLDESAGTTVNDSSLNTNDGTMYNMDPATDRVTGKVGNALEFDGVNDYVYCGSHESLRPNGSFTLSAWVYSKGYVNNGSAYNVLMSRGTPFGDAGGYGFAITSDDKLRFTVNNVNVLSGVNIKDRWVHVVGVYDDSEGKIKIYIDGKLKGQNTCSGLGTDTQTLYIGKDRI